MRLQWLVLAVFVLATVADYFVLWRSFTRRVTLQPAKARRIYWAQFMLIMWACSALVIGLWIAQDLPMSALGLAMPVGWRLWAPAIPIVALVCLQIQTAFKVARLPTQGKARLRDQTGSTGLILPHAASELPAFLAVSLTAGFCEELLFRGFLIWILQPFLGVWIAAIASLAVFALGHAYQGTAGMIRSAVAAAVFTAIVVVTRSLWPAIVLHAAVDWMGGLTGWLFLRDAARSPGEADALSPG
jgi:uncharacterized protein